MILEASNIVNYGVRVEYNDITEPIIKASIQNAELLVVAPMLGDEAYNKLIGIAETTPNDALIAGGKFGENGATKQIAGIKAAIANIAFAFILRSDVVSTSYGSVIKYAEESRAADASKLYKSANGNYNIGVAYVRQVAECMQVKLNKPIYKEWTI